MVATGGASPELHFIMNDRGALLDDCGLNLQLSPDSWHGETFVCRGLQFDVEPVP